MSFYTFKVRDIDGKEQPLEKYKGKPSLVVNVASECGFTPQYTDLQKLFETYNGKINVLGFPCNQFGKQEPGTNEEIKAFCSNKYKITFPMFSKIDVKGESQASVYKFLNEKSNTEPKWNFHKYLIDPEGMVIGSFPSQVKPFDDKIINKLKKYL